MIEALPVLPPPLPSLPVLSKPRVWPVFVAFVALLVLELIVPIIVVVVLALLQHGASLDSHDVLAVSQSAPGLLISFVGTMTVAAGLALTGAWLSPISWRERLRLRRVPLRVPVLLAGTLGVVSVGLLLAALMELGVVPRSRALDALDHMMKGLSAPGAVLAVLLLGLLPGFVEELLFRGYIQTRLVARWGAVWGIGWSALLFGVSHLDPIQGAYAVVVGCLLGFLTVRTGSVVPAMICHALNNTLSMILAVTAPDRNSKSVNLVLLSIGLVLLPSAILYLRARLRPAAAQG